MKVKFLLLQICSILLATHLNAHNGSINGQILEKSTGIELPGAIVRLDPSGISTSSNALGFFNFQGLPAGEYTLTISYLGFESKTIGQVMVRNSETTVLKIEMSETAVQLDDIEIATAVAQPFQSISSLDIKTRPINSTQDVLRVVPGLFLAQHAGGGKAEQIFLRGFDIDHGTDIKLSVDGIPVNMVSHAHGQGYADLHFVIPEILQDVSYMKGPYQADAGDFATAGQVKFRTTDALEKNLLRFEAGQFNTTRLLGAFNLLGKSAARKNQHAYLATEGLLSGGYFEKPQDLTRYNLFAKYSALIDDNQRISFSGSTFQSSWNASGQIPERAIKSGLITRFGAIDDTEGGNTRRTNLNFEHLKSLTSNHLIKNQFYYTDYSFELFSNFTFFKENPEKGDGIRQKEHRQMMGYNGSLSSKGSFLDRKFDSELGLFVRNDRVQNSELSRVFQRSYFLGALSMGDIQQVNAGAYASGTWKVFPFLTAELALRADFFNMSYQDALDSLYNPNAAKSGIFGAKYNVYYDPSEKLRLYFNSGTGFHSNDARVVVQQKGVNILPNAAGLDIGVIFKPTPNLLFNIAGWQLALEQEFVYVGDEAIVEAGGATKRMGIDASARWQFNKAFYADFDLTYSKARSTGIPEAESYIPLAPRFTATGGLSWERKQGLNGSIRFRHLGDRPANESNSVIATGYFLLDAVLGWNHKRWAFDLSIQNLFNEKWKEAQFETESRLPFENEPVTEIHFTPGTPFFLKSGLSWRF
jgi:hypothetical protein